MQEDTIDDKTQMRKDIAILREWELLTGKQLTAL